MKRFFVVLFLLTSFILLLATPSWLGFYGEVQRQHPSGNGLKDATPITFEIAQNDDYYGLHCELGYKKDGVDYFQEMNYQKKLGDDSVWEITLQFPPGDYQYWFRGYDDWKYELYENNTNNNYQFEITDDDLTEPIFSNPQFIESNKKFQIDIFDESGIYDDGTGSSGQGIYLIYDDDNELVNSFDGEIQLSNLSGNTFITDTPFPYEIGTNVIYKVFAYDNDFDNSLEIDRSQGSYSNSGVLPVELTSFTASAKENIVTLNWQTATEVNNYGFEVQRANNNTHTSTSLSVTTEWETIGFVEGHGNSNSPKSYSYTDNTNGYGSYHYRLKQIDTDGQFEIFDPVTVTLKEVEGVLLKQNYPNPFNPSTTISFGFDKPTEAKLKVYNTLGKEVAVLYSGKTEANKVYHVDFDASNLASGVYFYSLSTEQSTEIRKMLLIK